MSTSINFDRNKQAGQHAKDSQFKKIVPSPAKDFSGEAIEIDHTRLDVTLVEDNGVLVRRPWLSIAMDRRTRECVNFTLSADAPPLTVPNPLLKTGVERLFRALLNQMRPMLAATTTSDREGGCDSTPAATITKDRLLKMISDICQQQPRSPLT
jgi:hypothetical protein